MLTRDRVMATILGTAVGDSLGMPVEMMTAEKIREKYGLCGVTGLLRPDGHKYFDGKPAGWWTDDTSLTLAILKALTEAGGFDIDIIMKHHALEYDANKSGFGPKTSTAIAIERYKAGEAWRTAKNEEGKGNGVAMKITPIGIYYSWFNQVDVGLRTEDLFIFEMKTLADVTHRNGMGQASGLVQAYGVNYCLEDNFTAHGFLNRLMGAALLMEDPGDNLLSARLRNIAINLDRIQHQPVHRLRENDTFGNGKCYIPDSLPFTYAHFLHNPHSIETLFDVVNAGGDTDTNGAMCGALLGALNGMKLFRNYEHLIDGLWRKDELIAAVDAFCTRFNIA